MFKNHEFAAVQAIIFLKLLLNFSNRVIRAAIIDDDEFYGRIILCEDAVDCLPNVFPIVVIRDKNREEVIFECICHHFILLAHWLV